MPPPILLTSRKDLTATFKRPHLLHSEVQPGDRQRDCQCSNCQRDCQRRRQPVPPAETHSSTINCPDIKDDKSHISAYRICNTKRKKLFYFISFGGKLFKNYRRYHSVIHTYYKRQRKRHQLTSLLIGSNGDIDDYIDGNIHSRKASDIALNIARTIVSGS